MCKQREVPPDNFVSGNMEEKLIVAVSSFPVLYDTSLYSYRDTTMKTDAWSKVAEVVGVPGRFNSNKTVCVRVKSCLQ